MKDATIHDIIEWLRAEELRNRALAEIPVVWHRDEYLENAAILRAARCMLLDTITE